MAGCGRRGGLRPDWKFRVDGLESRDEPTGARSGVRHAADPGTTDGMVRMRIRPAWIPIWLTAEATVCSFEN